MTTNIEATQHLDFELPLIELERKIKELEDFSSLAEVDLAEEIKKLRGRADRLRESRLVGGVLRRGRHHTVGHASVSAAVDGRAGDRSRTRRVGQRR